jgi:hypothetical protein
LLDNLDQMLHEVGESEKAAAAQKAAEGQADPGSIGGPSSHPVASAPNNTVAATEGPRSSENESDTKADYGSSTPADPASENTAGGSDKPSDSIGTQSMDASEVAGNVQQPKPTKEGPAEGGLGDASPGHPSNATFNEKYSFDQNLANLSGLGNQILLGLATAPKQAADAANASGSTPAPQREESDGKSATDTGNANVEAADDSEYKEAAAAYPEDAEAGYLAAQMLTHQIINGEQIAKEAAAQQEAVVGELRKDAAASAELLCDYVEGHMLGQQHGAKQAMGDYAENEEMSAQDMAEDSEPGVGMEDAAPMIGAEELGAGGGAEEAMMGGGGGDEEAVIEALADALAEAGVSPDALAEAVSEAEGEGEGGMEYAEPEMGGEEAKVASAQQASKAALSGTIRELLNK